MPNDEAGQTATTGDTPAKLGFWRTVKAGSAANRLGAVLLQVPDIRWIAQHAARCLLPELVGLPGQGRGAGKERHRSGDASIHGYFERMSTALALQQRLTTNFYSLRSRKAEIYLDWASDVTRDPTRNTSPSTDPIFMSLLGEYDFDCESDVPSFFGNATTKLTDKNNPGRRLVQHSAPRADDRVLFRCHP